MYTVCMITTPAYDNKRDTVDHNLPIVCVQYLEITWKYTPKIRKYKEIQHLPLIIGQTMKHCLQQNVIVYRQLDYVFEHPIMHHLHHYIHS
jgi:hypothetical protein